MSTSEAAMRCLVACEGCRRQFDVAGFAPNSRFHCSCGATLSVPEFKPHAAAVVRCSSCGAPRAPGASACEHCRADYTLHEQDMHTVCPSCMTLLSDRARFCHHCATPIVPQGSPGSPTTSRCPACGKRQRLNSRDLGDPPVAVLECPACAGVWLSNRTFEMLAERSRASAADAADGPATAAASGVGLAAGVAAKPAAGPLYRRCPECDVQMNRRNFGRRSGVILDVCRDHGTWFDPRELEAVLGWIRAGGEARARKRDAEDERARERSLRVGVDWETKADRRERGAGDDLLGWGETAYDLVGIVRGLFNL